MEISKIPQTKLAFRGSFSLAPPGRLQERPLPPWRRFEFLVRARSIIIKLMIEMYGVSLSQLGRMLKIDHSTVIHHRRLKAFGQRFWTPEKTIHEEFKKLKEELNT